MSVFEQSSVRRSGDGAATIIAYKLRRLIPAVGAIAYPFLLDGFHLAVSPAGGPILAARIIWAVLCLLAAISIPFMSLICAVRLSGTTPSRFEVRASRLAYITI